MSLTAKEVNDKLINILIVLLFGFVLVSSVIKGLIGNSARVPSIQIDILHLPLIIVGFATSIPLLFYLYKNNSMLIKFRNKSSLETLGVKWLDKSLADRVGLIDDSIVIENGENYHCFMILKMNERPFIPLIEESEGVSFNQRIVEYIDIVARLRDAISKIQQQGISCTYSLTLSPLDKKLERKISIREKDILRHLENEKQFVNWKERENLEKELRKIEQGFLKASLYIILKFSCSHEKLKEKIEKGRGNLELIKNVLEAMLKGAKLEILKGRDLVKSFEEIFFREAGSDQLLLNPLEACALLPILSPLISDVSASKRLLFSYPSPKNFEKGVSIGYAFEDNNELFPVYLTKKDVLQRVMISGVTGSGKSLFAKNFVDKACKELIKNIMIIDQNGEYRSVVMENQGIIITPGQELYPLQINVFDYKGENLDEHILWLHGFLHQELSLSEPGSEILRRILEEMYRDQEKRKLTLTDVLNRALKLNPEDQATLQARNALIRKLRTLLNPEIRNLLEKKGEISFKELVDSERIVSFDLTRVINTQSRRMIVNIILKAIFDSHYPPRNNGNRLNLLLLIDEAQEFFRRRDDGNQTIGEQIIDYLRKAGVGVIMIAPSPSNVGRYVARNSSTKICFRTVDQKDKDILASNLGLTKRQKQELSRLNQFEAIFFSPSYLSAFPVRFRNQKFFEHVTDEQLKAYINLFQKNVKLKPNLSLEDKLLDLIKRYMYLSFKELKELTNLPKDTLKITLKKLLKEERIRKYSVKTFEGQKTFFTILNKEKLKKKIVSDKIVDLCFRRAIPISEVQEECIEIGGGTRIYLLEDGKTIKEVKETIKNILNETKRRNEKTLLLLLTDKDEEIYKYKAIKRQVALDSKSEEPLLFTIEQLKNFLMRESKDAPGGI